MERMKYPSSQEESKTAPLSTKKCHIQMSKPAVLTRVAKLEREASCSQTE